MAPQTLEFLSRTDGGVDTAPQLLSDKPTFLEPELQTDGQGGGSSSSETEEYFEGISPEEVQKMMEVMRRLVGATEKKIEALPVQPLRLQYYTLMTQADAAESCFDRRGDVEYIDKAIECRRRILSLMPIGHVATQYHLQTFSHLLLQRFRRLGDLADIDQAIHCLGQVINFTPDGDSNEPSWSNSFGVLYTARFERLGEILDLDKAIECHTQAVQLTPDGHPDKPGFLRNLGTSYRDRFERLGELSDLDNAIEHHSLAMQLTPGGHPDRLNWHHSLGNTYKERFERIGKVSDLENAIECYTETVQLTPDGHPDKPGHLSNLGNSYLDRFKRLGELSDLDNATECHTQAVQLTPDGHPDKPFQLNHLGNSYKARFERLGELSDLDNAIECHTQAVQLTLDGHADKPCRLNNLGATHRARFEGLGELSDLGKAIEYHTLAVELTPDIHPHKSSHLNGLGSSYLDRFERLGELSDLGSAIEYHTLVVQLTPDGHPDKPGWLNNLGNSYEARFERLGELSDLENAMKCRSQAMQLTPDGHPDKPDLLDNLGGSFQARFERLGELSDLDDAVGRRSQAMQLTPDGHPDKPIRLNNLGISYIRRFHRLGELSDLDNGVECHIKAVQLTPDGHADKPSWLNNLGSSYLSRFEHLGELSDLNNAVECKNQAMQLTPDGHPDKPCRLNNIGNAYKARFEHLGNISDLHNAIKYHTLAVQPTIDIHPHKLSHFGNLGNSYLDRFERLGEPSDLDSAIEYHTLVVQLTPDGHPGKPGGLNHLGNSYLARFKRHHEHAALELAHSAYQRGAQLVLTSPNFQLQCARSWAKTSSLLALSPKEAYEKCMELVPHLIWLGATINHRYTLLTDVSSLATEAASWAISVQAYDLAVEWLEEGRTIVWNQILQLRTPLDDLSAVDPALASHLQHVASQLESSGTRQAIPCTLTAQSSDLEKAAQHHRRLAAEWEKCLNQVRSTPGFENFMRRRKASELKLVAKNGPVVLINAHSTRWDALVILPGCDDVAHIPLHWLPANEVSESPSQLNVASVAGQRGQRVGGFGRVNYGQRPEDAVKEVLVALWPLVVKPILDALGCTRKLPINELPHVTWCATGLLALVPLHAAGAYDDSSVNAFDLVISSYTPSLSALLAASASVTQSNIRVLAVGQESTPRFPPLPSTVYELAAIKQHVPSKHYQQLDSKNATVEAVLAAMEEHSWVHLACHATQDSVNPAHSAFHLYDGNLTLEAITKRQFKNKGLAFLSACETAHGDSNLPDEAVHLAAGMLMAGFPSVIATNWSIDDVDGPEVAGRVYAELLKDGRMDHRGAARALHQAVAELRAKTGVDSFRRWVPFIHIGV